MDNLGVAAQSASSEIDQIKQTADDFGERIDAQNKIINDEKSSIEDVTTAQAELRKIKEEMLSVYGQEADGYNKVTRAIEGQRDALEELTATQVRKKISDYEDQNDGFLHPIKAFGRTVADFKDYI